MSADRQNVSVYAGDDFVLSVSIKSETGAPLPIAGATFVWTLAQAAGSPAILTKAGSNGITIMNAAIGLVSIAVTHADTAGLSGAMWHQLVMTDASGLVDTVTTGTINFLVRT